MEWRAKRQASDFNGLAETSAGKSNLKSKSRLRFGAKTDSTLDDLRQRPGTSNHPRHLRASGWSLRMGPPDTLTYRKAGCPAKYNVKRLSFINCFVSIDQTWSANEESKTCNWKVRVPLMNFGGHVGLRHVLSCIEVNFCNEINEISLCNIFKINLDV